MSVYTVFPALNSLSLVIRMSPFLLVQEGYLSHGRFISRFQERRAREGGGQSDLSDSGVFSNSFSLR